MVTVTGQPFDAGHIADQILQDGSAFFRLLRPLVVKVLEALSDKLPADLIALLTDASDGLDDAEIATWQIKLTKIANDAIDIPKVPEWAEEMIISPIVGYLLAFAKSGKALTLSAA